MPLDNLRHLYESLVEVSAEGDIVPRMAESFEASADAKTWAFKIRKGIQFHNGKDMTPDDVLKTMQRHSTRTANPVLWALCAASRT